MVKYQKFNMHKKLRLFFVLFSIVLNRVLALDPPYGQLKIQGIHLTNSNGTPVQLRGMSLFWSQWMPQFYNQETLTHLRNEWNSNVVRAAMGIESGGYLEHPDATYAQIKTVIEAAINIGIYVIADWHCEDAYLYTTQV
jgi:endoglucanase